MPASSQVLFTFYFNYAYNNTTQSIFTVLIFYQYLSFYHLNSILYFVSWMNADTYTKVSTFYKLKYPIMIRHVWRTGVELCRLGAMSGELAVTPQRSEQRWRGRWAHTASGLADAERGHRGDSG